MPKNSLRSAKQAFYSNPLSIIIIFCLGILVYSNSFSCSFHFDDFRFIVHTVHIKDFHNIFHIGQFHLWRYVTFFSLFINYHFGGLNVFGYHVFNLGVHLGAAFFVWWLTLLTLSTPALKENKITQHAGLIALFAGLVFVSHPIQTQAVTYIWQRAASLAALFYLASLCFYVKSRLLQTDSPGSGRGRFCYVFSLILAVVAMFTKENTVTLPLMALLYEISFFEIKGSLNWKYITPFLFTLFIIPLTMLLTRSGQIQNVQHFVEAHRSASPTHYLLTQFRVVVTYIRLAFLPLNQNIDYDYPISRSIVEFPTLISFVFLAGVLFGAKHLFSKYRLVSFSIFWFFLTLIPESSILPQQDIIVEHRLYLPLVGYCLFLVSGVYYLFSKSTIKIMVIILTMIIAFNSILTYQRNKVWKDELTLWDDAVQKSPYKSRPYDNRGIAYAKQGDFTQASADFSKAIEINPNDVQAYCNRGNIYSHQGNYTQALSDYNKAIEIGQNYAGSSYAIAKNYVEVYNNRGFIYAAQGNLTQAMSDFNDAIDIDPNYANAYYNRGLIYSQEGNYTQANLDFNKAIEIDPNFAKRVNHP